MEIIRTDRRPPKHNLKKIVSSLLHDRIFESCATLSYYFLFSIFPMLILISVAIGSLNINRESTLPLLQNILPDLVFDLLNSYITQVEEGSSMTLFLLAVFLSIFSMGKVIQLLRIKIRIAYRINPKKNALFDWLISFVFVFLMIVAFYATLILIVAGNRILDWVAHFISISESFIVLFHYLRVLIIAAFMFFVLFGIYFLLPGIKLKPAQILPGTVFSMFGWVIVSWLFSFYADNMTDYSVVYGSLGAIIILMTWLYLINFVILFGGYLNAQIYKNKFGECND